MSEDALLRDILHIPKWHQRNISRCRIICLVHDDWLQALHEKTLRDSRWTTDITRDDAALFLAPSHKKLPRHWNRVCIKVIKKSSASCNKLHHGPLYKTAHISMCMEHLTQTARENFRNLWIAAHVKYSSGDLDIQKAAEDQYTNVIKAYLNRLNPENYFTIPECHDNRHHSDTSTPPLGNNVIPILAVIETKAVFFVIQPYVPCSLLDIVSYSPAIFDTSHAKSLFVLYQVLQAMISFHRLGLSIGKLSLENVRIDDKLWVQCSSVQVNHLVIGGNKIRTPDTERSSTIVNTYEEESSDITKFDLDFSNQKSVRESLSSPEIIDRSRSISKLSDSENYLDDALNVIEEFQYLSIPIENLSKLTEDWVHRRINNFRYLMYLNFLAGRRLGDPNHHPVLPWVINFKSLHSGFRDLSVSKFRLNKGDSQLDFTFEAMADMGGEHVPHHVSDVLSDITYYVYKARRTQKHLLCSYVRTKWVPNEYPQSIQRMYEWTPDECIPEFFTDPTIFTSIHEDLPDLELPSWCTSAAEFVEKHLAVLECEQVSVALHNWIDLTFGFKLSGTNAVKSKNVYLHLVDQHKYLTNHGVVQLFMHPHPQRISFEKTLSLLPVRVKRAETLSSFDQRRLSERNITLIEPQLIKLPEDFDPTAALDHFEALHSFTNQTTERLPPSTLQEKTGSVQFSTIQESARLVWADMQQFGCLMCELYLAPRLQAVKTGASLRERYNMIGRLCAKDRSSLPRMVQTAAEILLNLDSFKMIPEGTEEGEATSLLFEYPMINSLGLQPPNPALLVQSFCRVIPFPPYFPGLFEVLNQLKDIDKEIEAEASEVSFSKTKDRLKVAKILSRKKVDILQKYLKKNRGKISGEGYELLLPYIKELFADPKTTVQAAWSLTGLVGKELGPSELSKNLMPYLTHIFSGEEVTPKHMKLYHRTFLVQLMLNLGLERFLSNFSTLLVEAVAGYKNFDTASPLNDDVDDEIEEGFDGNQSGQELDGNQLEQEVDRDQAVQEAGENQSGVEEEDGNQSFNEQESLESQDGFIQENEDIRPDQAEDDEDYNVTGDQNGDDDDDLIGEFPNISGHGHSQSKDSLSIDQLSQRSDESDLPQEGGSARGSTDRASIHSISHIMGMTRQIADEASDRDSVYENFQDKDTFKDVSQSKMKHSNSVQFDEKIDSDLSSSIQSKESDFQNDQSKSYKLLEDQSDDSGSKASSYMIRSETDEFRQIHQSQTINICDIAAESIKWLSHRLGPLLTAKYLSKNLVRMLALCYLGGEQVVVLQGNDKDLPKSTRLVQGDRNAHKVLECLNSVSCIYGEQVILLQYIPCIIDLILVAKKRLTIRAEAGLVAAVVLLRNIIPLLSDKTFLEILQESVIKEAIRPMIKLVSCSSTSFPSGCLVRSLILYKIVDVLYIIGLRLGFEMTRQYITVVLRMFFKPFEDVYCGRIGGQTNVGSIENMDGIYGSKDSVDESYLPIKMDTSTQEYMIGSPVKLSISPRHNNFSKKFRTSYSLADIHAVDERDETDFRSASNSEENLHTELRQTFSPELAHAAYIPLTSVFGSHHMEDNLENDDLIRKLCSQYDKALYTENDDSTIPEGDESSEESHTDTSQGEIGSNVAIIGNRICLQEQESKQLVAPDTFPIRKHYQHKGILRMDPDETRCEDMNHNKHRHLKGNWWAYWQHELGLNERDTLFNFKQIKLQTFQGHNNSIRSITCLDSENSFISASKDKTVKLWSVTSFGDGSGKCKEQWSYNQHKKSVFSVAYLENMRLVASCDSTVHIWDPFTGDTIRQLESTRFSPIIALTPLPSPSTVVVTATVDTTLKFLDMRAARYAHEYKCVIGNHGMIRCITASPDGNWVAIGFSSGVIAVLNIHTGILLGSWKAHDSEILQLKAYNKSTFLSTSFDLTMKLWSVDGGGEVASFKGHTEPVHCVKFYKSQIVSATTSNKIGVHTSVDQQANFSSTKLRSEAFKGVLTSMEILPLNRTLLLGTDNGLIRLLC